MGMGCVSSKKTGATALEYASKCYVPTTWIELPLVAVIPYNILSRDKPAGWSGESGHIDEAKVKKYCFPPGENTSVFVCGLPALYGALCGPRGQKEVLPGTILSKLGYTDSMVEKF